ncbi:hypothetical protein KAM449_14320 [Aeromonas caviae]|nr:hypothetical protein KAM352_39060 [Aeromonas caviae]GJC18349.1 hypothetical protein KAM377_18310 [Aeromonas caviae]GKQ70973.1 hypothetical protein KAM371_19780 [Aeromonas caviae]GKQ83685.1 hypothetical protein KAM449_14320 [Aeromonas caviae]GKS00904.1 hypothetical protein KAM486_31390 [Aeromonas caviae]
MLQFGLQTQTGVEGTLQQSNPVFQAAGRYDGTIVAAQHYAAAARIPAQIAHGCCRLRIQSNQHGQRNTSLLVHRFHSDQTLAFSANKTASA